MLQHFLEILSLIVRVELADDGIRHLKMLVILAVAPVAAPDEAPFGKQLVTQIIVVDLVGEVLAAVKVGSCRDRLDDLFAVYRLGVRVVERIDVYGKPQTML